MYSRGRGYNNRSNQSHADLEKSRRHTVWVGGLPGNVTEKQIMEFFRGYNPLSCKIIRDGGSPYSFTYFATEEQANAALAGKRGCKLNDHEVIVNISFNAYRGPRLIRNSSDLDPFKDEFDMFNVYDDLGFW